MRAWGVSAVAIVLLCQTVAAATIGGTVLVSRDESGTHVGVDVREAFEAAREAVNTSHDLAGRAEENVSRAIDETNAPEIPDPTAPTRPWASATLHTPLAGAEVAGAISLTGTARAERGFVLRSITIHVDDHFYALASGLENWTFTLDTTRFVDGNHTLTVTVFAAPAAAPEVGPTVGWGKQMAFKTLNHAPAIVLYEREVDVAGATGDAWVTRIHEPLTGLRVTFHALPHENATVPLVGQAAVSHVEGADDGNASGRTSWTTTHGLIEGGSFVWRPEGGVVLAPGLLTIQAAFAGEGRAILRVEALPAR